MIALIIVDLSPIDKEKLNRYSAMAAETLIHYDGKYLAKGSIESLHGDAAFQAKVIIQFPTKDQALNCYNSEAYLAIIPLRDQGMCSQFHLITY